MNSSFQPIITQISFLNCIAVLGLVEKLVEFKKLFLTDRLSYDHESTFVYRVEVLSLNVRLVANRLLTYLVLTCQVDVPG